MSRYVDKVKKEERRILKNKPNQSVAHRFDHLERVQKRCLDLATKLFITENKKVDEEILQIAALLHDIEQPYNEEKSGHVARSAERAEKILRKVNYPESKIKRVLEIISEHSSEAVKPPTTIEAKILFDADKLDGLGAVGIARVFTFCGQRGLTPREAVQWYEQKIRKTKSLLQTKVGKELASKQVKYVLSFLERFKKEEASLKAIQ